jgi:hypothetical protein
MIANQQFTEESFLDVWAHIAIELSAEAHPELTTDSDTIPPKPLPPRDNKAHQ